MDSGAIAKLFVPEKAAFRLTIEPDEDSPSTADMVVEAFAIAKSGTSTLVGVGAGAATGVDIALTIDASSLTPGQTYTLEVVADRVSDNPVTLVPNALTQKATMYIQPVTSIS